MFRKPFVISQADEYDEKDEYVQNLMDGWMNMPCRMNMFENFDCSGWSSREDEYAEQDEYVQRDEYVKKALCSLQV